MLRILLVIAVALAVIIGLMRLTGTRQPEQDAGALEAVEPAADEPALAPPTTVTEPPPEAGATTPIDPSAAGGETATDIVDEATGPAVDAAEAIKSAADAAGDPVDEAPAEEVPADTPEAPQN